MWKKIWATVVKRIACSFKSLKEIGHHQLFWLWSQLLIVQGDCYDIQKAFAPEMLKNYFPSFIGYRWCPCKCAKCTRILSMTILKEIWKTLIQHMPQAGDVEWQKVEDSGWYLVSSIHRYNIKSWTMNNTLKWNQKIMAAM